MQSPSNFEALLHPSLSSLVAAWGGWNKRGLQGAWHSSNLHIKASAFISERWQMSCTLQVVCGKSSSSKLVPWRSAWLGEGDATPALQLALLAPGCPRGSGCPQRVFAMPTYMVLAFLHPSRACRAGTP